MIYFDNAATTKNKPQKVIDAYFDYVTNIGVSPGRGTYPLAVQASRMLYQSRKTVATYFDIEDSSNVVFTKNSTEAINLFLNGFLMQGDHVLISPFEHNAVLRPLHTLKNNGIIDYTVLPEEVVYNPTQVASYIRKQTKLIALTLASNLTGQYVFSNALAKQAKSRGLSVFVDASQGAGKRRISLKNDDVDFLAFTGHKDLLALPGVGGLVANDKLTIQPLIQGGTGIHGESYVNPPVVPDSLEAGTLNMPAIWALKNSIDYLSEHFEDIRQKEEYLLGYALDHLSKLNGIIIYRIEKERVPTFCFNISGISSSDVVAHLNKHDICVRAGIHCAILAHETINTVSTGAVRISLCSTNTVDEIDRLVEVLGELL